MTSNVLCLLQIQTLELRRSGGTISAYQMYYRDVSTYLYLFIFFKSDIVFMYLG